MTRFRILFGLDLLIVIFALWECYMIATSSLTMTSADGQTTIIPQDRWLVVSPVLTVAVFAAVVLGGAAMLHRRGRTGLATLLLLVPAVLVVLGLLLMVGLMILFTLGTPHH
jgi:amino acid permease